MKRYSKKSFPVSNVRRYLEPGPIVLVSSAYRKERNIMTLGWHLVLGFTPSLVGCYIWDENHSFGLIKKSKQCVINIPTADLIETVIGIGNCHGSEVDKFETFGLTPEPGKKVSAPLITECYASFECKLIDTTLINRYGLFMFEVVKAHVASSPKYPKTVHYRGDGAFMFSGPTRSYRSRFKRENL